MVLNIRMLQGIGIERSGQHEDLPRLGVGVGTGESARL